MSAPARTKELVSATSGDVLAEQTAKLRMLFPEVFVEGKIDFDKLKGTLGACQAIIRPSFLTGATNMTQRITTTRIVAIVCLAGLAIVCLQRLPSSASQASSDDGKADPADQIKELKSQLTELKDQVAALKKQRVVAAGTATYTRPDEMDNTRRSRVKLSKDIVKGLGEDYVVLLTMRIPTGGHPYFNCYWKSADDGFDIAVIDSTLIARSSATYANRNNTYLIDWVVIKK